MGERRKEKEKQERRKMKERGRRKRGRDSDEKFKLFEADRKESGGIARDRGPRVASRKRKLSQWPER